MGKYTREDIIRTVREQGVEFIRMQFTDIFGQLKNVSITGSQVEKALDNQVTIDGKNIELSYKEFELLAYFMENQGIALSREKILNNVWNYDYFGDARTIDTHVKKLRSKLGEKGDMIKTIWGMGYKFEPQEA